MALFPDAKNTVSCGTSVLYGKTIIILYEQRRYYGKKKMYVLLFFKYLNKYEDPLKTW